MRRVLFLAYYFPPLGGAGVQRSVKFVQYLPAFGYDATVVTAPGSSPLDWTPPDETLAAGLPAAARVTRVGGPEPTRSSGWRSRSERWLRVPTEFARWWIDGAVATGAAAEGPFDAIVASMSPFESAEAASQLARRLGIPWIADLRDPWALDEALIYPTRLHRRLEADRMRRALGTADAIVMNAPEATKQLHERFPELRAKRVVTIPNGFDADDFAGPRPARDDGSFRIVHAGFVHAATGRRQRRTRIVRRGLGGSVGGYDVTTRSHVFLLRAVERLLSARPELRHVVEVHLAGVLSEADRTFVQTDVVRERGYLPHPDAVALLRSADLLFLPMHDLRPGTRARIVPGKTYEYLAAGPPILAAVPDGDARDLLRRAGGAMLCRPSDVAAMEAIVAGCVDAWRAGDPRPRATEDVLRRFERRQLTAELAAVLDSVVHQATPAGEALAV